MIVRREKPYYYTATIYRGNRKVIRQGTINADSDSEAIDRVYDMGKTVWKRAVLDVILIDPKTGQVIADSYIGDRVVPLLLPDHSADNFHTTDNFQDKADALSSDDDIEKDKAGFIPWDKRNGSKDDKIWNVGTIGTYFNPHIFNKL